MNKRNRERLLSLARVLDSWAQSIRRRVKANTPRRKKAEETV